MKKFISTIIVSSLLSITCVWAEGRKTPINISIFPPCSLFKEPNVIGLDIGLFGAKSKDVYGIQFSVLENYVENKLIGVQVGLMNLRGFNIYGAQIGIINNLGEVTSKKKVKRPNDIIIHGVQVGGLNIIKTYYGSQIGIINFAMEAYGPQIGIINVSIKSFIQIGYFNAKFNDYSSGIQLGYYSNAIEKGEGIQIASLLNWAGEYTGLQIAFLNYSGQWLDDIISSGDFKGMQLGIANGCRNLNGIQIGVINGCETLKGIQIGVINICLKSKIPVLPIINVGW